MRIICNISRICVFQQGNVLPFRGKTFKMLNLAKQEFMEVWKMKFIIVGGDAAGMSAASRAKRNRPDMEVTVLEKTRDVSYSA